MEHLFHSRLSESSGVFGSWSDVLGEDHLLLMLLNSLALEQLLFCLSQALRARRSLEVLNLSETGRAVLSLDALSRVGGELDGAVVHG